MKNNTPMKDRIEPADLGANHQGPRPYPSHDDRVSHISGPAKKNPQYKVVEDK